MARRNLGAEAKASLFRDSENRGVNRHLFRGIPSADDDDTGELFKRPTSAETTKRHSASIADLHPNVGADASCASSSSGGPLFVLLCTANLGSAEPSQSSIAALLPRDGRTDDVLESGTDNHPLPKRHTRGYGSGTYVGSQIPKFQFDPHGDGGHNGGREKQQHWRDASAEDLGGIGVEVRRDFHARMDSVGTMKEFDGDAKGERFDLIVVAMQEATFRAGGPRGAGQQQAKAKVGGDGSTATPEMHTEDSESPKSSDADAAVGDDGGTRRLRDLIAARLGDGYIPVVQSQRGEMRLTILVAADDNELISSLSPQVSSVSTGIGSSVLFRKGGIVATLTVRGTRLTFTAVHLEPHEGPDRYAARCSNLADIFAGCHARIGGLPTPTPLQPGGPPQISVSPSPPTATQTPRASYDPSMTDNHVFVLGDLNFRIALPGRWDGQGGAGTMEDHRAEVRGMVYRRDWAGLCRADELGKALRREAVLAGFRTLPCRFPPTFKVERGRGFHFREDRTPSYTDRIMWKSATNLGQNVRPLVYEPIESFVTSDHKPIRGAFAISMSCPGQGETGS